MLLAGSVCVDEAAPVLSAGSVCHPGVCVLVCWAWGHPTCRVTHRPGRQCSSEERSGRVREEGAGTLPGACGAWLRSDGQGRLCQAPGVCGVPGFPFAIPALQQGFLPNEISDTKQ